MKVPDLTRTNMLISDFDVTRVVVRRMTRFLGAGGLSRPAQMEKRKWELVCSGDWHGLRSMSGGCGKARARQHEH